MDSVLLLGGGGFALVVALALIGVPVGAAMGLVGLGGAVWVIGLAGPVSIASTTIWDSLTNYTIAILPLFILMGNLASAAGLSSRLYQAMRTLVGHREGGLALATIGGCAGFGMVCGSSLATAATMGRIAIPEMKHAGYPMSLASGTIAAGGALGILIPPSTILVIYAFLASQSVKDLMLATLGPIVLGVSLYALAIFLSIKMGWETAPKVEKAGRRERVAALGDIAPTLAIFTAIMGGLYSGAFTANETGAIGASVVLVYGLVTGRLRWSELKAVAKETAVTCASLYFIVIGASIYNFFLTLSGLPFVLTDIFGGLISSPILLILVMTAAYLFLGAVMDSLAMLLLTVPLFAPIAQAAGIDLLWFGMYIVLMVEIALITPPVGMNLFVIKACHPEIRTQDLWRGVVPFVAADVVRLAILVAVPLVVTWLPQQAH